MGQEGWGQGWGPAEKPERFQSKQQRLEQSFC